MNFKINNSFIGENYPTYFNIEIKDDLDLPILVISNKIDLESQRIVSKERLEKLKHDFKHFWAQYDQRRGKSFVDTFPKQLTDWYNTL